jgi:phosphatidylserine/phosphatidylglycerophosphate/cardiolipin synthase-like enzyme
MIDSLIGLPAHLRERLAGALESEMLSMSPSESALQAAVGSSEDHPQLLADLKEMEELGISGQAAAAWMRSLARVEARMPRADLVWSGPEVPGLHARDTRTVHDELLGSARRSVWVSTYVYFDGPKAFGVLARRMEAVPELRVTLLLNVQRKRGDTTGADHLVRKFADRFWSHEWPGAARPQVFYDPRAIEDGVTRGVLHAKAVVVDDETVCVTSANLTEAAFDRNIELGVVVRDPTLAATVTAHFHVLIERGLLSALPVA